MVILQTRRTMCGVWGFTRFVSIWTSASAPSGCVHRSALCSFRAYASIEGGGGLCVWVYGCVRSVCVGLWGGDVLGDWVGWWVTGSRPTPCIQLCTSSSTIIHVSSPMPMSRFEKESVNDPQDLCITYFDPALDSLHVVSFPVWEQGYGFVLRLLTQPAISHPRSGLLFFFVDFWDFFTRA